MQEDRSLKDCMLETVDDIDHIAKQVIESLLNRDKHQKGAESLTNLVQLFEGKHKELKAYVKRVPEFRERELLIRKLQECVQNRNTVIERLEANLKIAECLLTSAVHQASKKVQSVRTAEAHMVDSEEVIKLAHQISRSYSVAAPLFWSQGDPSRPFPTEPEFRNSSLLAPRSGAQPPSVNPLRVPSQSFAGVVRTPPTSSQGIPSPMSSGSQQRQWSGVGSPRMGYQQPSTSPRARSTAAVLSRTGPDTSGRRSAQNSPRLVSPTITVQNPSVSQTLAQPTLGQMSSDSSSSSSSEDEGPNTKMKRFIFGMVNTPDALKELFDKHLPDGDGFESYIFSVGDYNDSVSPDFKLKMDQDSFGILILSTPDMFDVSFRRWFAAEYDKIGSLKILSEEHSSPLQDFMSSRLEPIKEELSYPHELLHDHSMWPNRKPKILMQTCGHVSGAAYYYQPMHHVTEDWPPKGIMDRNSKFIGLSLHPIYGGHFAFRSVFLFPTLRLGSYQKVTPLSILSSPNEIRSALEKFNFSWRDSNFRDFGTPKRRYSRLQMEYFGKPPSDRWDVLLEWLNN